MKLKKWGYLRAEISCFLPEILVRKAGKTRMVTLIPVSYTHLAVEKSGLLAPKGAAAEAAVNTIAEEDEDDDF